MRFTVLAALACLLLGCGPDLPDGVVEAARTLPEQVDFNQHIRPILSDRCWSCHGPDRAARKAGLRLDTEEAAFATLTASGRTPIVAGKPNRSELVHRILSEDPEIVMPTPESKLTLSDRERALLVRWIEQGASWKDHWAFLPVEKVKIPENPVGYPPATTAVDNFINARLSVEGMAPAPRAQAEILIRRLYQDLTGLPPSLAEVDGWLADPSDEAYRALVDDLLATDAYAERMTMEWMDVARYADSHGRHADGSRTSYPYRDWVISAFKRNLPYSTFLRYQLAGDLIDEPTYESRLATAFLRMHPMTGEGGAIEEETRLSYVFDRVNTVSTGLLGLTMDCARCHDHKFDPLSQEEYYGFSAFFNTVEELGMTPNDGDFGPRMVVNDKATYELLRSYRSDMDSLDAERRARPLSREALARFAGELVVSPRADFSLPFDRKTAKGLDGSTRSTESFTVVDDPERGRVGLFDHGYDRVDIGAQGQLHSWEEMSATVWVNTDQRTAGKEQSILCNSGTKEVLWRGIDFFLDDENHLTVSLAHLPPDDRIEVRTQDSLRVGEWYQVGFTYDGTGLASGVSLYVDGDMASVEVLTDGLTASIYPGDCVPGKECEGRNMRIGRSYRTYTGDDGIYSGRMDALKIYYTELSPLAVAADYGKAPTEAAIATHQRRGTADYRVARDGIRQRLRAVIAVADTSRRLMVMEEMDHPRKTYLLLRGAYDAPGKEVGLTTPVGVLPWTADYRQNRAGLVDWLLSDDHPLTSRVIVNRYWQLFFGQGIVSTPHDFGSQGSIPTHPALLDYLADEFRGDWDLQSLIRKIVLSDTYRRSSTPSDEQREQDPGNDLLARGARFRLPAEMIRDQALAVSGLLNTEVGGHSVKPYQPEGLWIGVNSFSADLRYYVPDHGSDLYRRSMYTFIRRTAPPPFQTNFDGGGRDVCIVKRSETNTPLQALNLLNDPQFVEAARVLGERVIREGGSETDDQLRYAYRLVTGRQVEEAQLDVLSSLYQTELERFTEHRDEGLALLAVGEYRPPLTEPMQTAAMASVSNMLLSLDASYVKY